MSVHPPKPGLVLEEQGAAVATSHKTPPKRSYTRRRAGVAEVASSAGPKAAPTLIEASAAVHREQARGSDSDVLPTMVECSPFGSEPGVDGGAVALSPELAAFEAALVRSGRGSSAPSSPPVAPGPAHTGAEEGGVAKTLYLSPVELAVERVANGHEANAAPHRTYDSSPTLGSVPPPKMGPEAQELEESALSPRLLVGLTVAALSAVLCAALLGWMVS